MGCVAGVSLAVTFGPYSPCSFTVFVSHLLEPHKFFGVAKDSLHRFVLCAALLLNSIWHLRNDVVHNQVLLDPWQLLSTIRRRYGEHCLAWTDLSVGSAVGWSPPPVGGLNATLMLP